MPDTKIIADYSVTLTGVPDPNNYVVEFPVSRQSFRQAVRALDAAELAAFAADLYAARGWSTTVDDGVIELHRNGKQWRVLVFPDTRFGDSVSESLDNTGVDAVVAAGRISSRDRSQAADHNVEIVDEETLYERLHYGIRSDVATNLLESHLDLETLRAPRSDGENTKHSLLDLSPVPRIGVTVVVLIAVLSIAIGIGLNGIPGLSESISVVSECPSPPADSHPATLRPQVEVMSSGLGGWTVRNISNYTSDDPVFAGTTVAPRIRFKAQYRIISNENVVYNLQIDQWETQNQARQAAVATAGRWNVTIVWGTYTIAVLRTGETVGTPPPETILTAIKNPNGQTLDSMCVDRFTIRASTPAIR